MAPPTDTRVRHKVLGMTMVLAAITYLDRVSISVARPDIARDLNLSPTQMGYVFSAFYLAYAAFEIPTGWWGDRIGTRRVLTRIVCWWSAFTVLTGVAFSYPSLLAIRFLFGAGEAGALPNAARTFSRWFPRQERGTAQGIFFMSMHLAGGLTPLLVTALLVYFSWRSLFALFGSLGFLWAVAWYRWFRDSPADHPGGRRWRAPADRERAWRRHRPCARRHAMEAAALEPYGRLPVPDVFHAGVRRHLLRDVAADLSRVARPHRDDGGHSRGVAADPQFRRGSPRRRRH